jgi:predicted glycosyltransferase
MFFCNEMLGLGHLRRALALTEALVARDSHATGLVVTGSPAFGGLPVPHRVDILKLPTSPVSAQSAWSETTLRPAAELAIPPEDVAALRSKLSLTAVRTFAPSLVVVDYLPLGRNDDLRAALEWCRRDGHTIIALGLRDCDDAPARLRSEWTRARIESVRALYDVVLVYGPPSDLDVRIDRLRAAGVPIRHTGIVAAPPAQRGPADLRDGYLLATTGGGVDGFELLAAVLDAIRTRPPGVPAVLVTGPMMGAQQVARLREQAAGIDVRVEEFRPDMDALIAGAGAVVAMAGYCTVAEILNSGKPALLVPRTSPREEQLSRARRWAAMGRVAMLDPRSLEPERLGEALERLLERSPVVAEPLTGAGDAVTILLEAVAAARALAL